MTSYVVAVFFPQDNWSALLYSAKEGHLEIVIELLERGADIEHRDLVWNTYIDKLNYITCVRSVYPVRQQCKILIYVFVYYKAAVKCKQTSSAVRKWWNVLIHDVIALHNWLQSLVPDWILSPLWNFTLPHNNDLLYFHGSLTVYDVTMFKKTPNICH